MLCRCILFPLQLGSRSYAIRIAPALLQTLGGECARLKLGEQCAIITDKNAGNILRKRFLIRWPARDFRRF